MVWTRVCTKPNGPKGAEVCKEGNALIDTGAVTSMVAAVNLPEEMFPEKILGKKSQVAFLSMKQGSETRKAKATIDLPGCTRTPLHEEVDVVPGELPRRDIIALLGVGTLAKAGATVHSWSAGRSVLWCHPKRRKIAPRRKGVLCSKEDPRICGDVVLCPPDARDDQDPACRPIHVTFDTGAPSTVLWADAFPFEHMNRFPPRGTVETRGWARDQGATYAVTAGKLFVPGCQATPTQIAVPPPWEPVPADIDGIVGMDVLVPNKVSLHPWSKPGIATCRTLGRKAPGRRHDAGLIEW